ncbi:hypothetical protein [Streptomyces sp. NPDC003832]
MKGCAKAPGTGAYAARTSETGVGPARTAELYAAAAVAAGQLPVVWRGADGALLRLDPGGTAELERTPTESGAGLRKPWVRCGGGTWTLEQANRDPDQTRDGVALHPSGDCGRDTYWVIGGTESDPELFVLFGDPDAGELWVLER